MWTNYDAARWRGVRDLAHEKLYPLLSDDIPEVHNTRFAQLLMLAFSFCEKLVRVA